jgi:hypothetical protein
VAQLAFWHHEQVNTQPALTEITNLKNTAHLLKPFIWLKNLRVD